MKPGDRVRCRFCGRVSEPLHDRGGEPWPLGALVATWEAGPAGPMHTAIDREDSPITCAVCAARVAENDAWCRRPPPGFEVVQPASGVALPVQRQGRAQERAGSPLERFEALAAAFRAETGMLAPGKDQPAAMGGSPSEEERAARWRAWCTARAAAAAPPRPPPPPKGQLALL